MRRSGLCRKAGSSCSVKASKPARCKSIQSRSRRRLWRIVLFPGHACAWLPAASADRRQREHHDPSANSGMPKRRRIASCISMLLNASSLSAGMAAMNAWDAQPLQACSRARSCTVPAARQVARAMPCWWVMSARCPLWTGWQAAARQSIDSAPGPSLQCVLCASDSSGGGRCARAPSPNT